MVDREQAEAVVGYLQQQLVYQLACHQETRYHEILAGVDEKHVLQEVSAFATDEEETIQPTCINHPHHVSAADLTADTDQTRNLSAEAEAVVSCLQQQLVYQQACHQETRYHEQLADVDKDIHEATHAADKDTVVDPNHHVSITEQTTAATQSDEVSVARDAEESATSSRDISPLCFSSTTQSPYETPPETPTMPRLNFLLPIPSLLITSETQTDGLQVYDSDTQTDASPSIEGVNVECAVTQTDLAPSREEVNVECAVTQTDPAPSREGVNVECQCVTETFETATNTSAVCVEEAAVNTELSTYELLQCVHDAENARRTREEHARAMVELNEEKSKRLVSEQLAKIVQSDLMDIRQQNIMETTAKIRLENEVADLKVELDSTERKLREKEARVHELEESLAGTMHMVQKLEEQSAVLNKGGIDYLLLSKISEGKALEAEQRLKVLQTELLHSQSEVQRLMQRLEGMSLESQEMVSGKVHDQLLRLADERAERAERKLKEIETEFMRYKTEQKSAGPSSPLDYTSSNMSSYPSSYSTFSSSFLSSSSPSSYTSPFKLSWDKPTTTGPSLYPSTSSGPSLYPSTSTGPSLYPSTSTGPSLYPVTSTGSSLHSSTNSYLPPLASKPGGAFSYTSGISKPTPNAAQSPLSSVEKTGYSLPLSLPVVEQSESPIEVAKKAAMPTDTAKDDDSSDWTSSDDDDDEGEDSMPRPSAHVSLQAKWEWLSQQDQSPALAASDHTPPRKSAPPPVAPKPKLYSRNVTHDIVSAELPVTFEQPPTNPSLAHFNLSRPHGPRGRRLPTRHSLLLSNVQLPQLVL